MKHHETSWNIMKHHETSWNHGCLTIKLDLVLMFLATPEKMEGVNNDFLQVRIWAWEFRRIQHEKSGGTSNKLLSISCPVVPFKTASSEHHSGRAMSNKYFKEMLHDGYIPWLLVTNVWCNDPSCSSLFEFPHLGVLRNHVSRDSEMNMSFDWLIYIPLSVTTVSTVHAKKKPIFLIWYVAHLEKLGHSVTPYLDPEFGVSNFQINHLLHQVSSSFQCGLGGKNTLLRSARQCYYHLMACSYNTKTNAPQKPKYKANHPAAKIGVFVFKYGIHRYPFLMWKTQWETIEFWVSIFFWNSPRKFPLLLAKCAMIQLGPRLFLSRWNRAA